MDFADTSGGERLAACVVHRFPALQRRVIAGENRVGDFDMPIDPQHFRFIELPFRREALLVGRNGGSSLIKRDDIPTRRRAWLK